MTESDLLQALARGEDSRQQFKRDATNADGMAAELAALANSGGGTVFLGVADDGCIAGLDAAAVRRLNQLISNAASQHVRPPLHPQTHNVQTAQGLVLVVSVPAGLNKPYMDLQGRVWVKSGADKRHVTAREEMQRMFQRGGLLQADQVPVRNATVADIDERAFGRYFERRYGQSLSAAGLALAQLMENLKLAQDGVPNLAGVLLFGKHPQRLLPVCQMGAVWFPGTRLSDTRYL
ncbi:MAG: helix-turn-helix domain-containing protein, partial [Rhodoferax sp.]